MTLDRLDPTTASPPGRDGHVSEGAIRARPERRKGRLGGFLLKLLALLLVAGAGVWAYVANTRGGRSAMDMNVRVTSADTAFPVTLVTAERSPISGAVTYTGSVVPFNEEDIYPRVTGRIVEMPVYPGDQIRAGQVVARLDDVELTSRVREAQAMRATAESTKAQMEAEVTAARQGIAQAEKELASAEAELTYARSVAARSEQLVAVGAISKQEYENDRSIAASLEAKRDAARARIELARAMETSATKKVEAVESTVAQAAATARTAQIVRDYVTITAPSNGYVVKRLVAPGVLVQPGTPILKLTQIDRIRLQANVGEKDVASIRLGSPVTVTTTAGGPPLTTRVTAVFPFVDVGARTAIVEALVDNAGRRFLPGQYVTMQFSTGERGDAVTVPRAAVARLGGKGTVWVVRDDRAEPRSVTTGLENPERVEVTQGLAASEQVVARGHEALYAGARVADVARGKPAAAPGDEHKNMPGMSVPPATPGDRKEPPHAGH
jgi:macrolide-specific efflux system membrane fusion protein